MGEGSEETNDFIESVYSYDEIEAIKERAPNEKPKDISWSQWLGPKITRFRHHPLAMFAALHWKVADMAKQTGIPENKIAVFLNRSEIQREVKDLEIELFHFDPKKRFRLMLDDAIEVIEAVMKDGDEKGQTRLQAAALIKETVMGKPTQVLDVGGSLIRQLLEKMDGLKKIRGMETIDITPNDDELLPKLLSESISDDNSNEAPIETPSKSEADAWADTFLGEN